MLTVTDMCFPALAILHNCERLNVHYQPCYNYFPSLPFLGPSSAICWWLNLLMTQNLIFLFPHQTEYCLLCPLSTAITLYHWIPTNLILFSSALPLCNVLTLSRTSPRITLRARLFLWPITSSYSTSLEKLLFKGQKHAWSQSHSFLSSTRIASYSTSHQRQHVFLLYHLLITRLS